MVRLDWIEQIRRDNRSGASVLAARAARALAAWAAVARSFGELEAVTRQLVEAQPRMAPLLNLADLALKGWPETAAACATFLAQMEQSVQAAASEAAALIPEGATVSTHSSSATVLRAFELARQQGRCFRVISTESRPAREGATLARALAASGIAVRLVVDAAAALFVPESTLVMVGADAVCSSGVVNKVGTLMLALAAREYAVPVYAVATTEKFVPASYRLPPEPPHDPAEVEPEPPAGCEVANYYFEATPLGLFTGIVTEEGLLSPQQVYERLACRQLHPALLAASEASRM